MVDLGGRLNQIVHMSLAACYEGQTDGVSRLGMSTTCKYFECGKTLTHNLANISMSYENGMEKGRRLLAILDYTLEPECYAWRF